MNAELDQAVRAHGGRVLAALAARLRDLDLAEEAFAEACLRAARAWPERPPRDPAAWLYAAARRAAWDALRRKAVRARAPHDAEAPPPTPEEIVSDDAREIPDERLRLIFVCCHPAVAPEARAALTLRLVCGLTTAEIADAFLIGETALRQRLVRAKRKIADAGVPFEVPDRAARPERLEAVLTTLEVAYAQAYADAAGAGAHAGYAEEMLRLTGVLAELLPEEPEVLAYAALTRFAEARRPARLDETGAMVPLSEQDPALWRTPLIEQADALLKRAGAMGRPGPRQLQAAIHAAWCGRRRDPRPPWRTVLALYDLLLEHRDDEVVRLNRAVALGEVAGPEVALAEPVFAGDGPITRTLPWRAARAHLLSLAGRRTESLDAFASALACDPAPAERLYLERRAAALSRS